MKIVEKPVKEIFDSYTDIFKNKGKIKIKELVYLTNLLISLEIDAGGPYKNEDGKVERETNMAIYNFLKTQKISLKQLNKYLGIKKTKSKKKNGENKELTIYCAEIEKLLDKKITGLNTEIKNMIRDVWQKLKKGTAFELIVLSPVCLNGQLKTKILDEYFIKKLSLINVLGWITYTIYDDLMDDDKKIEWLPVANIIARIMYEEFYLLMPENTQFIHKINTIMEKLEEANWWELKNCRQSKDKLDFGSIEKLSDRSMGHALTTLALIYKSGGKSDDVERIENFYRYFLAARQMNDDAHDWVKDYKKGQINSASAELMKKHSNEDDIKKLEYYFWENIFDGYAKKILKYCKSAKKEIDKVSCFETRVFFDKMVDKIIKSTVLAIKEKTNTEDFINDFFKP